MRLPGPARTSLIRVAFRNLAIKIHEAMKLQIRAEFFNFTNTPRFAIPDTILTDGEFGQVTSTLGSPRHMQFGVRFEF